MKLRRRLIAGICAVALASSGGLVLGSAASARSVTGQAVSPYPCSTSNNSQFQAASGQSVDVSAIGWLGNDQGAVACLGGSFFVQNGIDTTYGYGVYNYSPTTWTNADGYLPALVTGFADHGTRVSITNFGDRVVLGGHAYVAVYSRVAVHNPTSHPVTVNPEPSAGLLPLNHAPDTVPPGQTVDHDYVVASDRFGNSYRWPTATQLEHAGGWTEHFAHMRAFWNAQLAKITQLSLPDPQVVDAYKADFIYCQIDRSGVQLDTGTNGYHAEYEHDVIGILNNMFNEGFYSGAHALLNEVNTVVGTNGQYADGLWTYPWLWAVYLEKTGDLAFLKQHFAKPGSLGASKQPSIEATAHLTAADRTGPGGIMEETSDIDANGYWTSDNFEALLGLASYVYLAKAVGNQAQARWGEGEYASLQKAVDATLAHTAATYHLDYLPCSMVEPNTYNRCADPLDANWAAPGVYTNEAWHAYTMGATVSGIAGRSMASWLDSTLRYGFARTAGVTPPTTFGGYPGEGFWSTTYNAGYGAWGLGSTRYRDESIVSYEFLLANDQSGPYAWWEGSAAPADTTPWIGNHPSSAGGASPHSWGVSLAAQGLLDSLASQMSDGTLIVGRGVPTSWLAPGKSIDMSDFPVTDGHRLSLHISSTGHTVSLGLRRHAVRAGRLRRPGLRQQHRRDLHRAGERGRRDRHDRRRNQERDRPPPAPPAHAGRHVAAHRPGLRHSCRCRRRGDGDRHLRRQRPRCRPRPATGRPGPGRLAHHAGRLAHGGQRCRRHDLHRALAGHQSAGPHQHRHADRCRQLHRCRDGPPEAFDRPGTRAAGYLPPAGEEGRRRPDRNGQRVRLRPDAGNVERVAVHRPGHHVERPGNPTHPPGPAMDRSRDRLPGPHPERPGR